MTKLWFYRQFFIFAILIIAVFNTASSAEYVPGELIIKLKNDTAKSLNQSIKGLDGVVERKVQLMFGNLYKVRFDQKADMEQLAKIVSERSDVLYAEPNYIWKIDEPINHTEINRVIFGDNEIDGYVPNDPKFGVLWGLHNTGDNDPSGANGVAGVDINAIKAWEISTGSRNVRIGVIDTGIDYTHPDLAGNMWVNEAEKNGKAGVDDDGNGFVDDIYGYDFANDDGDPRDGHSHGTHCAGTIGAVHNNNEGVAGIMDKLELVAIKFLSDSGSGATLDAVESINYGITVGVDLLSNSWGGGGFSQALHDAIQAASDAGIIFVAAAGNSSQNNDSGAHYPSSYDVENIIAVASHTNADRLSSFSCYGKRSVELAAPGSNIMSTVKGGKYASYSGTSMATPHVSGALGLMLSVTGRMSHAEMRERVILTSVYSRNYKNKLVSAGRLDVYNLMTDTHPPRPWEPGESEWITVSLDEVFESEHNYGHGVLLERTITIPGAKLIRAKFARFETENKYDYMSIAGANGEVVEKVTGTLSAGSTSDFVNGDTLKLTFKSDQSVDKWGFLMNEVQVIYNVPE